MTYSGHFPDISGTVPVLHRCCTVCPGQLYANIRPTSSQLHDNHYDTLVGISPAIIEQIHHVLNQAREISYSTLNITHQLAAVTQIVIEGRLRSCRWRLRLWWGGVGRLSDGLFAWVRSDRAAGSLWRFSGLRYTLTRLWGCDLSTSPETVFFKNLPFIPLAIDFLHDVCVSAGIRMMELCQLAVPGGSGRPIGDSQEVLHARPDKRRCTCSRSTGAVVPVCEKIRIDLPLSASRCFFVVATPSSTMMTQSNRYGIFEKFRG